MEFVENHGCWRQTLSAFPSPSSRKRPALFLDRDGVVVEEVNYLHRVADMRLIEGAATLIHAANERMIPVVMVTNQSGVGRGYYDWSDFAILQEALVTQLATAGAHLDLVLACAFHADAQPLFKAPDHPWRKPRPGMLHAAADTLALELGQSWIVGDSASDVEAGRNAGLAGAVHVATGHGERDRITALAMATSEFEVQAAKSLTGAMRILPRGIAPSC
jgi:D-glycero-D-manno-heptose 1,7-bisphosphate phosphatase